MGDWSLQGDGQDYQSLQLDENTVGGVLATTGATANTKGAWTTLGTAAADASVLALRLGGIASWTAPGVLPTAVRVLVDVAQDATTPTVVVQDLLYVIPPDLVTQTWWAAAAFPLQVPGGTQLAFRAAISAGAPATVAAAALLTLPGWSAPAGGQEVETWGSTPASTDGTNLTPGTAPAWGGWTQLTGATIARCDAVVLALGVPGSPPPAGSTYPYVLQLGVGASGQEVAVLTYPVSVNSLGLAQGGFTPPLPCTIPPGSRVSARLTGTGGGNLSVVAYGCG